MHTLKLLRIVGLALLLALPAAQASQNPSAMVAGHIAFINGQVQVRNLGQSPRTLQHGAPVYVGDQLQTQSNSHLHLRMVDNAFVALRPGSQLTIEAYDYRPEQPEASRIRMDLQNGTSRAVSGKGGQAAKHQYRFNTPLAAIGLRGTDYTVIADSDKTRVSVAQGGVIVSPFTADCTMAQLGPCSSSPLARELTASMPGVYLEITGNQKPGVLIDSGTPRPAEGAAKDTAKDTAKAALSVNTADLTITQAKTEANAPDFGPQPADTTAIARWGRWSSLVKELPQGSGSINQVIGPLAPFSLAAVNNAFALAFPSNHLAYLPKQGQVNFSLVAAEAYTQQAGQFSPAKVKSGVLEMDFAKNSFTTQLNVVTSPTHTEKIQAQGGFDAYGRMQSVASQSNANVKGIVLNRGQEAAYLFDKTLTTGASLSGAAQWGR